MGLLVWLHVARCSPLCEWWEEGLTRQTRYSSTHLFNNTSLLWLLMDKSDLTEPTKRSVCLLAATLATTWQWYHSPLHCFNISSVHVIGVGNGLLPPLPPTFCNPHSRHGQVHSCSHCTSCVCYAHRCCCTFSIALTWNCTCAYETLSTLTCLRGETRAHMPSGPHLEGMTLLLKIYTSIIHVTRNFLFYTLCYWGVNQEKWPSYLTSCSPKNFYIHFVCSLNPPISFCLLLSQPLKWVDCHKSVIQLPSSVQCFYLEHTRGYKVSYAFDYLQVQVEIQ